MMLPSEQNKRIDKVLELIWIAKDILNNPERTEEDFSRAIGNLKRADCIITDVQYDLCSDEDDNDL